MRHGISEITLDLSEARKHARGLLKGRASQTGERRGERHWSVGVLGMFAGNSKEAGSLELILSRGGSNRELGQSGSQRTLCQESLERWKRLNYVSLFFERKRKALLLY